MLTIEIRQRKLEIARWETGYAHARLQRILVGSSIITLISISSPIGSKSDYHYTTPLASYSDR